MVICVKLLIAFHFNICFDKNVKMLFVICSFMEAQQEMEVLTAPVPKPADPSEVITEILCFADTITLINIFCFSTH